MALTALQMALMSRLLDEALPLDEPGRRRWLANLAPEYHELAEILRDALLPPEVPGTDVSRLDALPILEVGGDGGGSGSGLRVGDRVGPYRLIRLLGTGGMAEVWLAQRADGAFRRDVALKLPMLTRMRKDLEHRFAIERDILASLEHPNIARLYDAGIDHDGLPYLSMEYVQGKPLNTWCDERRLPVPQRISLFLQVLNAVQFAHEKFVVHRDIKPSNILVSDEGQARLLDFGVAKLLQQSLDTNQAQLTNVYGRALTPEYSSPELLRGDPVDERSDIYSLGVLLYELLTGKRPSRAVNHATTDVRRPSTQVEFEFCEARDATRDQLSRRLRGDLDAIALKMLAESPAERYATVGEVSADLIRHLRGQPIKARPAALWYRMRKKLQRNRGAVAVSAGAVLLAAATLAYTFRRDEVPFFRVDRGAAVAKSVAVLPFVNLSQNKDEEYFSDGLSLELIDRLAQIPGLQVIAHTSSFAFKGKLSTNVQIGRALGVSNLIEGSVRRVGSSVRVTAQLIRADNGSPLWSRTFDRDVKEIFQVQTEIAAAVVSALQVKMLSAREFADPYRSNNAEAYNLLLLAKQQVARRTPGDYSRAAETYRRATQLDPRYAAAFAGLSICETKIATYTLDEAGFAQARRDAEKALALSPRLIEGFRARILIERETLDFAGARADTDRLLAIAPGDSMVQSLSGVDLAMFGAIPEATAAMGRAIDLDPLNSYAWAHLGLILMAGHDYPGARRALERAIAINQDDYTFHMGLGQLNLLEGRLQEALEEFQSKGSDVGTLLGEAMVAHSRGDEAGSTAAVMELIAKHASDSAYQVAEAYAWRGDKNKSFEWLETAIRQRDSGLNGIAFDPLLEHLHGDPRFDAMLRKLKLAG